MMLGAAGGFPMDFDYGTIYAGVEDSDTVNKLERPAVSADPHNENRWAITFTDDDGNSNKRSYVVIATRTGKNLTFSDAFDCGNQNGTNGARTCWLSDTANKFVIAYRQQYGQARARVITVSGSAGSESFTRGSEESLTNKNTDYQHGVKIVPLGTTGRYIIAVRSGATKYLMTMTINGSTGAITHNTEQATGDSGTYHGTHICIDPNDATKGMMALVNNSEKLIARSLTFSGTGTSASITFGSEQLLIPNTNSGGGFHNSDGWSSLHCCGSGKYMAIAKGGDSPYAYRIVGTAFDFDGSNYTLGNYSLAPDTFSTVSGGNEPRYWVGDNQLLRGNSVALVGHYPDQIGSDKPIVAVKATRKDDRTITWSDQIKIGNETGDTGRGSTLHNQYVAVQTDSAHTALAVWNNNYPPSPGQAYDNLQARLIQLGS